MRDVIAQLLGWGFALGFVLLCVRECRGYYTDCAKECGGLQHVEASGCTKCECRP